MSSPAKLEAGTDSGTNILRLSFAGNVRASDMPGFTGKVNEALTQTARGFKLLVNFVGLESMEAGCAEAIRTNMDAFNARGVQLIVRVIPDRTKDIGLNIMSLFHYPRDLKILTVDTLDEGENALTH